MSRSHYVGSNFWVWPSAKCVFVCLCTSTCYIVSTKLSVCIVFCIVSLFQGWNKRPALSVSDILGERSHALLGVNKNSGSLSKAWGIQMKLTCKPICVRPLISVLSLLQPCVTALQTSLEQVAMTQIFPMTSVRSGVYVSCLCGDTSSDRCFAEASWI